MAGSPRFKVYTADGEYVASCKHIELAASGVSLLGKGATIRDGHAAKYTVWREGVDGWAGDSYDTVAAHVFGEVTA